MKESLYFIAILPEEGLLRDNLYQLKVEISETYQTYQALKSPPHITLQSPFKREHSFEKQMIEALRTFAASQTSFNVLLKNYDVFPPKVLYIRIQDHLPFINIHSSLNSLLKNQLGFLNMELMSEIHPHLTLAYRDLDQNNFSKAWKRFKAYKFEAQFTADRICLLKHNGHHWDIYQEFQFGKMNG